MKKSLLIILSIILLLVLSGCCLSHEWADATCTAPKTCTKCGKTEGDVAGHTWKDATCTEPKRCETCLETEGSSLGHSFGNEEIANPNYVSATATFIKTCTTCQKTEERNGTLTQLHDGHVVLMSAEDFSERFTEKLMEVQTLLGNDQYLSFIDKESDDSLVMYYCQRSNGNITMPGTFVMRDENNQNISYNQHNENGAYMGVVGIVSGTNQSAIAFTALVATMEPSLELLEVTQYASDFFKGTVENSLNGVTFSCTPIDANSNLIGFGVHE